MAAQTIRTNYIFLRHGKSKKAAFTFARFAIIFGIMIIAACYDNTDGSVFGHFGRTEYFKIYDVEDGSIASSEVVSTEGTGGHEALGPFLKGHGVEVLIAGGAGQRARDVLAGCGIKLFPGVAGDADEAVRAYIAGDLRFDMEASCCHHHEGGEHEHGCHHDGEGHHCHR